MSSTKKFSALRSRAEEIAAQKKVLEEAEKEYKKNIDDAVKHAGRTRAEFVEKLYDFFTIEPETTLRRDKDGEVVRGKDGRPVEVKTDRNEAVRIQKLAEAFARLVDGDDKSVDVKPMPDDADSDEGTGTPVLSVLVPAPKVPHEPRFDGDAA